MMSIVIPLILLVMFLVFGMPIAFALGVSGGIGLLLHQGLDSFMGILQTAPYSSVNKFILSAIPMFILMAALMTVSGITKEFFHSAYKWVGHLPGGLGLATVFAGAGLGAVSGSSTASAATLAKAAAPEMQYYKYSPSFTMGVVSVSGTLALMIPPSIILIMYGVITETGIGSLLIAGIIPGILTGLGYIVVILVWVKLKPDIAPHVPIKPRLMERVQSLQKIWPMMLIILAIVGGIYFGVVTPTEAGALGAFVTLIVILIMRKLTINRLNEALTETLKSTAMILLIIISAHIFSYFLTITHVTQDLVGFVSGLNVSPFVIMLIIVAIYIILGFFLDQLAILILTLPLTFPIIIELGFNPIWFGIVVTKAAEIGLVTPPVGMNVFVAASAAKMKIVDGFRGVTWFVVMDFIILAVLLAWPAVVTWLPDLMR